ncbi:uncharacterized protein LOC135213081 [Macrobrachium nipponense]|uniref:uncharacterized protein LOC135213081 n=1 Tax=Macrobrachium nipponense TaxID=159736 RepID=UPI0030C865F4
MRFGGLLIFSAIVLLVLTRSGSVKIQYSKTFELVLTGQKLNGNYTSFSSNNVQSCASHCITRGCWLLTWDVATRNCSLLDPLTALPGIEAGPSTLRTYFCSGINNARVKMFPEKIMWTDCRTKCEDLGGRMFLPPDYTYGAVLTVISGFNIFHVGMYRYPNDTKTWYNMDGQVISPPVRWGTNEPNNGGGVEYYVALYYGGLADIAATTDQSRQCPCEI